MLVFEFDFDVLFVLLLVKLTDKYYYNSHCGSLDGECWGT